MEFNTILVPIIGTGNDEETVRLACHLAKRGKGKLYAIHVIAIKRSLPLEAEVGAETTKAEGLLDRAEKVAAEEGCKLETELFQARDIAPVIVNEAISKEIDLILIGVKFGRRFGQFCMGDVVPYVLQNASCRVILYSQ